VWVCGWYIISRAPSSPFACYTLRLFTSGVNMGPECANHKRTSLSTGVNTFGMHCIWNTQTTFRCGLGHIPSLSFHAQLSQDIVGLGYLFG